MNRRERQRLATFHEIVSVARSLLGRGEDPSLRAIATEMGMSPPGLYRYINSSEVLHALITGGILDDVIRQLGRVRTEHEDDPPGQLAATTAYLRSWALSHPAEFDMIFATPHTAVPQNDFEPLVVTISERNAPSGILSSFFGSIFVDLVRGRHIVTPTRGELEEGIVDVVDTFASEEQRALIAALPEHGHATLWKLKVAWTRLYGILAMEVFRQLDESIIESGLMFTEVMHETFEDLQMGSGQWDRLLDIARSVIDRGCIYAEAA